MPRVRLTRNLGIQLRNAIGGECRDGDVVEASGPVAEHLAAKGLGVVLDEPKPEPEKPKPEIAESKPATTEPKIETKRNKGSK